MTSDTHRVRFLLEEQKQRRAEIENSIRRIELDLRGAIIGSGLYWYWLFDSGKEDLKGMFGPIGTVPFLCVLLLAFRWWAFDGSIKRIAEYTKKLEQGFAVDGWESFVASKPKNSLGPSTVFNYVALGGIHALVYFVVLLGP